MLMEYREQGTQFPLQRFTLGTRTILVGSAIQTGIFSRNDLGSEISNLRFPIPENDLERSNMVDSKVSAKKIPTCIADQIDVTQDQVRNSGPYGLQR